MKPKQNKYPHFVPDQLLTSCNLNVLFKYLDEQDRITRTNLTGIGVLCGLELRINASKSEITISEGCGITSEGYLVSVPSNTYTKYSKSEVLDNYLTEYGSSKTIVAFEMNNNGDFTITKNFLEGKVVLIYVEVIDVENKKCSGDKSCDDKGETTFVNLYPLIIKPDEVSILPGKIRKIEDILGETLPKIKMPRWDVKSTSLVNAYQIKDSYLTILSATFISNVQSALTAAYKIFQPFIDHDYPVDPFAGYNLIQKFSFLSGSSVNRIQSQHIQYYYDFFSDLIEAYHEFIDIGNQLIFNCCPDESLFPKHLFLGKAIPNSSDTLSDYRQYFIYAPGVKQNELLRKLKLLFHRMVLMLKSFNILPDDSSEIRITPSVHNNVPLSSKAIPYYYTPNSNPTPLLNFWSTEKPKDQILSYHRQENSSTLPDYIKNPLKYDLEPYNFFRIEGFIGKSISEATKSLKARISEYRLPFKIIALSTGKPDKVRGKDVCCFSSEFELQYKLIRDELLICVQSGIIYWGSIENKKDQGKVIIVLPDVEATFQGKFYLYQEDQKLSTDLPKPEKNRNISAKAAIHLNAGEEPMFFIPKGDLVNLIFDKDQQGLKGNSMGQLYLDSPTYGHFDDIKLPDKIFKTFEEKVQHYILGIIDKLEKIADLLAAVSVEEFDYESFIKLTKILNTACSELHKLIINEYLIRKIRINAPENEDLVYRISDAFYQLNDTIAIICIRLLRKLSNKEFLKFITELEKDPLNSKAQKNIIDRYSKQYLEANFDISEIKEPAPSFKKLYQSILEHLKPCNCRDYIEKLKQLMEKYEDQISKLKDINNFSVFAKTHPGLQHKAGVSPGGTFILVYKGSQDPGNDISAKTVVADFYLPYSCNNDCTPVEITFQEAPESGNLPPVAKAGDTIFIKLPTNSAMLDGSTSYDPDGTIKSYKWEKIKGPAGYKISSNTVPKPTVSNMLEGTYVFKLTVTDDQDFTNSDTVTITLMRQPDFPPTAVASADKLQIEFIDKDNTIIKLIGSGSRPAANRSIETYAWITDPHNSAATIEQNNSADRKVTFNKPDLYGFKLTVTDDKGATDSEKVFILVSEKPAEQTVEKPKIPPVALATADPTYPLFSAESDYPKSRLIGSNSSDPAGGGLKYFWSCSPFENIDISDKEIADTTIIFKKAGTYLITLRVEDSNQLTDKDYVYIKVDEKKCGSLDKCIANFNILKEVNPKEIYQAFKDEYLDFYFISDFFGMLQKEFISSKSVEEQLEYFSTKIEYSYERNIDTIGISQNLVKWIDQLSSKYFISNQDHFWEISLRMLNLFTQLTCYVACIYSKDVDNDDHVEISMLKPLKEIITSLEQIEKNILSFFQKPQDPYKQLLNTLLDIIKKEKDRAINKPNYLGYLEKIKDVLRGMIR